MQLEEKQVKPSTGSSRASLKKREESSACPEAMEGPKEGQKTPDPDITIGSAAPWASHGELVQGGNLDCKGVIAMGFLCSGSRGTQLKPFHTAVLLNKFIWRKSCRRLCFRQLRSSLRDEEVPESERVVVGGVEKGHPWARRSHLLRRDSGLLAEVLGGGCATPWLVYGCSGGGFSLNTFQCPSRRAQWATPCMQLPMLSKAKHTFATDGSLRF